MKQILILFILVYFSPSALSQIKVMALGESTTAAAPGYRKKFFDLSKANGLNIDMIGPNSDGAKLSYDSDNAGFRGKICSDLLKWIDSECLNYSPDIVILWEGTNDCGWGYKFYIDNHTIIDELSLLVNIICIKYPDAHVFVASIPPMSNSAYEEYDAPAGLANSNAKTLNNEMPGMINLKISEGKKVHFIDARSLLSVATDISSDGIHPNQKGYDMMGVLFYNTIHPYLTSLNTENESDVVIYPNPVTDYQLIIKSKYNAIDEISLSIYNIIGSLVYSADIKYSPAISFLLPENLTKGLYLLKINTGINTVIKRIVIQ